jgi:hypothetical protein
VCAEEIAVAIVNSKTKTNWKNFAFMAVVGIAAGVVPLEYRAAHDIEALKANAPILFGGVAIFFFVVRALVCDLPKFHKRTDVSDT